MKELMAYSWPGNVRELEHLIERTMLTTNSKTIKAIQLPLHNQEEIKSALKDEYLKTFEENERDHIIRVLNKCNGKIYGTGGAADILNLRVSTLNSKIKKLGIRKNKMYS
jgi:transcriptional regulator with GAF, ATPase, and Fis domain